MLAGMIARTATATVVEATRKLTWFCINIMITYASIACAIGFAAVAVTMDAVSAEDERTVPIIMSCMLVSRLWKAIFTLTDRPDKVPRRRRLGTQMRLMRDTMRQWVMRDPDELRRAVESTRRTIEMWIERKRKESADEASWRNAIRKIKDEEKHHRRSVTKSVRSTLTKGMLIGVASTAMVAAVAANDHEVAITMQTVITS
ncbi:MAG: hypothetical protein SGARI_002104, partial [Bacillariaceae sp.]